MSDDRKTPQELGGIARAEKVGPERRREISKNAAEARWGADMPQAEFEGDVKVAGRVLPAAVLPNGKRVLNQGQFLQAIGRSRTPKAGTGALVVGVDGLPFFLQAEALNPFIDNDLRESTTPIFYRNKQGRRSVGYDALLLPKVCEVYLKYRDSLLAQGKAVPIRFIYAKDREEFRKELRDADVVYGGLNAADLDYALKVKWVQSPGAGVESAIRRTRNMQSATSVSDP